MRTHTHTQCDTTYLPFPLPRSSSANAKLAAQRPHLTYVSGKSISLPYFSWLLVIPPPPIGLGAGLVGAGLVGVDETGAEFILLYSDDPVVVAVCMHGVNDVTYCMMARRSRINFIL